jgi:hypothetical protein
MARAPRRPHSPRLPPAATRRLTREEVKRLGVSHGAKRHVAADIKRVTKRTTTWSERQAIQARKGMTKEAYTKGIQRGEFAYSEKTAKRQRHVEYGRRISKLVPEMTAKDRRFMFEARDTYLKNGKLSPEQKDKWKSVFARYPKDSLRDLFGYPAVPPAAFPFILVA